MFLDRSTKKGLGTILLFKVMFPLMLYYFKGRYQNLSRRKVPFASNRFETPGYMDLPVHKPSIFSLEMVE